MIDKVLGFEQPVVRRKRPDNASETSQKKEPAVAMQTASPARSNLRKINTDEPVVAKEQEKAAEGPVIVRSVERPKPKVAPVKTQTKTETASDQQIASPAVKHLKRAVVAKNVDEMRNSAKLYLRESIRPVEAQPPPGGDIWFKLKVVGFLIVSLLLMLNAMTPARKVTYRRK